MELSTKAKDICKTNYSKNCGGCPLRPECCKHVGAGQEALDRWTTNVNKLAEQITI